jgi:hypothetical protein
MPAAPASVSGMSGRRGSPERVAGRRQKSGGGCHVAVAFFEGEPSSALRREWGRRAAFGGPARGSGRGLARRSGIEPLDCGAAAGPPRAGYSCGPGAGAPQSPGTARPGRSRSCRDLVRAGPPPLPDLCQRRRCRNAGPPGKLRSQAGDAAGAGGW